MNFWKELPKPFFVLAPMADVTDVAFRRVIAKYSEHTRVDGTAGGPDVTFTEFVSADGLARATPEGREKLMADLKYDGKVERPIVAQLFSANEEHMEAGARLCRELGFDGVDINMGCPDRSIEKQGCGSAMMRNPESAIRIIKAAKRGAKMCEPDGIPVSVKTRIGYTQDQLEEWIPFLLKENPAALIVHGRTRKEMSKVPAKWDRIKRAVEIRNELQGEDENRTVVIGNGDALSLEDAGRKAELSGVDGVMLGRAVFGNPWLFHPEKDASNVKIDEKLRVMVEHSKLFSELLPFKNFSIMKKHYKAYVKDFDGAHELRNKLMEQDTPEAVEEVVETFLKE